MKLTIFFTIALEIQVGVVACSKRLVLHSDQDVAAQFASMEARFSQLEMKLTQENQQLATRLAQVEQENQQLRSDRGYVGGSKYDNGGGSNSLCLSDDPTWGYHKDGFQVDRGSVYGTELDAETGFTVPVFGYEYRQQDPPCAVCSIQRPHVLMIPGRMSCFPGWTLEYTGYIVSGMISHSGGTDYICLDSKPETLPHGGSDDNEHVIYFTEAHCGSLPCPPYHDGWEIACVVCSK